MKKIFALTIVVGMVMTIVIADFIVDALTPMKSFAFTYRLIANVCTVIIFALIYWWKR
jgi:sorbitol-specific phosphotransferase system component IIBC